MIKKQMPLTMPEVAELAGDSDKEKAVKEFIKSFTKMKVDKAKEMREELNGLGILKLKEYDLVKVVDFMPKDSADLNKIITEVSLEQDEINKILEVVKKY